MTTPNVDADDTRSADDRLEATEARDELARLRSRVLLLEAERTGFEAERALLAEKAARDAKRIEDLSADVAAKARLIEQLQRKLDQLSRQIFGEKADKVDPELLARSVAEALAAEAPPPPVPPFVHEAPDEESLPTKRKSRHRGRLALPANLPRDEEEVLPPPELRRCVACDCEKVRIGEEITEIADYVPSMLRVRRQVRVKLACPKCKTGVVCAPPEDQPIDKGRPGAGLLAEVITRKYNDHLPLHRQSKIFERHGLAIPEATLGDWTASGASLLEPIADEIERTVLESGVAKLDLTGVRVLHDRVKSGAKAKQATAPTATKGTHKGHIMVLAGPPGAVRFRYLETKAGHWTSKIFDGFEGYLQADAASSFNALYADGKILEVGCNAHCRRKFVDAMKTSPHEASWVVLTYKKIYAIERDAKDKKLTPEQVHALRQERTKPLMKDLFTWIEALQPVPGSPLASAVTYAKNQRVALMRFLEDGRLDADNNRAELNLRQVAVGRHNWLFAGSRAGARRGAILYSLIGSCRELGIEPAEYLRDVIQRLGTTPKSRIRELTPIGWKAAREAKVSSALT